MRIRIYPVQRKKFSKIKHFTKNLEKVFKKCLTKLLKQNEEKLKKRLIPKY